MEKITMNNISNKAQDAVNTVKNEAYKMAENPKKEMKESGEDWINYIKTHPLQSVLFGVIGYFALKGMAK